MFCPGCGIRLPDDSRFCSACGRNLAGTPAPAAPTPPTAPPPVAPTPATRPAAGTLSGEGTRVFAAMPALPVGEVFDRRYRIDRVLGQGGMGTVYLAQDEVTGERVCLKVIRPELLDVPALAQRFLREGKITRSLRHPNVVAVYDVNVAEGRTYISMEYLPGTTLREHLRRGPAAGGPATLAEAAGILREILAGLDAAHRADLVHRDLKPENVMLLGDPRAGDCRLKVLDFGIARPVHSGDHLTVAGAAIGTPAYMAPEQEIGAEAVGPAADLYSVGAIFYELLTGSPPRGRWKLPSALRPDLTAAVDRFCEKALEVSPARRFETVTEMGRDLAALLAPPAAPAWSPVPAAPPVPVPPPLPPAPPAHRTPWWLGRGFSHKPLTAAGLTACSIFSYIPGLAFVTWSRIYRHTRAKAHLLCAILHSLPLMFLLVVLGQDPNIEQTLDEETIITLTTVGVIAWVVAIVHIRVALPRLREQIR